MTSAIDRSGPRTSHRSRRRFLRQLGLAAAGTLVTPPLLQACRGGGGGADAPDAGAELVISTFPLYIDGDEPGAPGSVARFRTATGIQLRYLEDISDARQFFARIQPQLASGRAISQDLLVLPPGWRSG